MLQGNRKASLGAAPQDSDVASKQRAVRYVVCGELLFLFFLEVSVALHPGFVLKKDEGGMSNYGLHLKTVFSYSLALGLLAFYNWRAGRLYTGEGRGERRLRLLLTAYSAAVFLMLLSTYFYSLNLALKDLHFGFGTVLIVLMGVGSLWVFRQGRFSLGVLVVLLVQLCGDTLALLAATGTFRALFIAEMLSNTGFAGLLVIACRRVASEDRAERAEVVSSTQ